MRKKRKYISEADVKRALNIETFRNLSKEKVMQFASMIPYVDKDVAIAIVNQFPVYADFGKAAVAVYKQVCDAILADNRASHASVVKGYQTVLDGLSKRLENPDITEEETKSITEDMIAVADKIADADRNNKRFLEKIAGGVIFGIVTIVGAIGAAIGISAKFSGSNDLPQLDDEDE